MDFNSIPEARLGPHLKSNEVHIWSAHLSDNERNISYFSSVLSKDEHQRANSFKFSKDRVSFIISRRILRCLLGGYLGQYPRDIEITYGLWGKPYLTCQSLYFNLSHSRDYVLYAVARSYEVGIDLEYIDSTLDLEGMALNILSSQELACWKNIKPEEKLNTFFNIWVCKEAFLKALGKGWLADQQTLPTEALEVFKEDKKKRDRNQNMSSAYVFDSITGYASALFIDGPALSPSYFTWTLHDSLL